MLAEPARSAFCGGGETLLGDSDLGGAKGGRRRGNPNGWPEVEGTDRDGLADGQIARTADPVKIRTGGSGG